MKKSAAPVATRSGNIEFLKLNTARWEWRDAYRRILTLSWPQFALLVSGLYLGVNFVFALLFLAGNTLGGEQVAEMRPGSFLDAFFFSVETLATVGYGHMYPVGLYGHLVATAEIIVGMFGMAVVTGLIFVRFSRPAASLKFTGNLVLTPFDGVPALMFRVGNQRHQPMMDAQFRLMMIRSERIAEGGEVMSLFYELPLQVQRVTVFPAAMTIRHLITEASPLHGATPETLEECNARFIASATCVDTVVAASVQSHQNYLWTDVRFGEKFVEIYTEEEGGRYVVDYARLQETEPAMPPERR